MSKFLLTLAFTAILALGADVTGTWQMDVQTDQGSGSPTFVLRQAGEKVTGTYNGMLGKADVHGTVRGDELVIEFETDALGDKATVRYVGKLEGNDKVKGKVTLGDVGGTFTGTKK